MTNWKAFVLMPFNEASDPVYEQLIKPALSESGFEVNRADLSNNQQQILKDIITFLADADLVIVDVSNLNGNVMYELGLAHAMGKRTVMITQDIDELPFDLKPYRANAYSTEFTEAPKLKAKLKEIADGVVDGTAKFSNPVQDFAPAFLAKPDQTKTTSRQSANSRKPLDTPDEEEDERGLLDFAVELSESADEIVVIGEAIADLTRDIGVKITKRTEEIKQVNVNLGAKAAPTARALMREAAKDFDAYTKAMEEQNPLLRNYLVKMGESANGIAQSEFVYAGSAKERLADEVESLKMAERSFEGAHDGVISFVETLTQMPSMEQTLSRAVQRTIREVTETAETISLGQSEFARARGLIEERLSGAE